MMTWCPRSAERLTWLPSASGRVKSGAGSPGARRSSVTRAPFGQSGRTHGTGGGDRGPPAQPAAPVADRVLGLRGHLGGGQPGGRRRVGGGQLRRVRNKDR